MALRDGLERPDAEPGKVNGFPSDPVQLTPEEQMAHAANLMEKELARSSPAKSPRAILTGGQPGAGKSYITRSVGVQFEGVGGLIVIDPDEIRPTLPYMKERIAAGDLEIPNAANVDAGTIAYQMVQIAKREKRNVLIDGTLQNTGRALDLAGEMKQAEYGVEFHGMSVYPGLSHARTYERLEKQISKSPTGFGRGVSDEFHDQAVKGYGLTVEMFQKKASVNSMTFYGDDGRRTVRTRLVDGQWVPSVSMKDELDKAHTQPTPEVLREAVETWDTATTRMRDRSAPLAQVERIEAFRAVAAARRDGPTITMGYSATRADGMQDPRATEFDLSDQTSARLATIVHAGVKAAGRDAGRTLMSVAWTKDEAVLEVKVPAARGYERFTLPGHDRVEEALARSGRTGTLQVDFTKAPETITRADMRTVAANARELGVAPADVGVAESAPSPRVPGAAIMAHMRDGRSI